MPDTNEPQRLADAKARMIETRVWIDDTFGPFDAKVDPTNRWNGWLSPFFTLDTVRELSARTQEMADEFGHDAIDTVHAIDGGADREGEPRAVVVHIRWSHLDSESESSTSIIQPNDEGLYGIGCWEWTWHFARWQCACGLVMHWHVTDCGNCDLTRDTQPDKTDTPDKAPTAKEPTVPDTDQPQPLADAEDPLIDAWVYIDTLGPYEAKTDPTKRRKGLVCPRFTLDTVRKIAARTQEQADKNNYESVETIHVIDGGTDREGNPRAVVLHVRWVYVEDEEEAQYATLVMQPDDEGLYSIGGDEWNWYEAAPDTDNRT